MIIYYKPENFNIESTTVWSFKERGNWATHSGKYRGNWSPYVPRNLILRYTRENDLILDQFLGSGTTLIEAKLLNRNAIGVDINDSSIIISKANLNFNYDTTSKIYIKLGDAKKLNFIRNESIDLICTHPPYSNVIKYSDNIENDISLMCYDDFLNSMDLVAFESYRVLKNGKICAIMIGDIRKNSKVVPLGFQVMTCFLNKGFKLKEIIIKEQHNCSSTEYWSKRQNNFLMLAHEYIFVFEK